MTDLKQYYKQIWKLLPCSRAYKKRLIHELKDSVSSYLKVYPDADMRAIEKHFGTSEQIAIACSTEIDASEIVKKHSMRKQIITVVVATAAVALALWLVALVIASIDAAGDERGYIETGVVIIEEGKGD